MDNSGLVIRDAAKVIVEIGPQVDALHDELDERFTEAFEKNKNFKPSGGPSFDTGYSDGDWVCKSIYLNLPLAPRKSGRTKTTHHLSIQTTLYDEAELKLDKWEPCVTVLFGTGEKDEAFEKYSYQLESYSTLEKIREDNLTISDNKRQLSWSTDGYEGWMFVIPLVGLNSNNLDKQIIEPAMSLIDKKPIDQAFPDDSLAFTFEISNNSLIIT